MIVAENLRNTMNTKLEVRSLAEEYRVNEASMRAFVEKFAPCRVADGQYDHHSDIMLFVHIPKTAGVSVGKSFQEAFDRFHGVLWNDVVSSFRDATQKAIADQARNDCRQVIIGHYGWPELRIWLNHEMDLKCGTVFREPTARLISNYQYNTSKTHPAHEQFQNRFPTLESYIRDAGPDIQLRQALGMSSSFQNILEKLTRHYTFLGTTERLASSLNHLVRSHGLRPMNEHKKNVGKSEKPDLDKDLIEIVRRKSINDTAIHELVGKLYMASEID
ncbi:hypothetical protein [Paracoccus homiensis]|uniref:hypothetical protein n=1 Tax=Paracoccus homiensis TaxID=364199 RepID=UPI00398CEAA0